MTGMAIVRGTLIYDGYPQKPLKQEDEDYEQMIDARWQLLEHRRDNCMGYMRGGKDDAYDRVEAKNLGYSI